MLRNKIDKLNNFPVIKLFSLSALLLLQTACGGGESDSEASAIGIQDVSIAYIKRPTPRDDNGDVVTNDMRQPTTFSEGGDLYLQERASSTATVKNITRRITNGLGDVKDVSVSYDGNKLLFSLRLEDPNPNDNIIPHWYLYEYDISKDTITQLTSAGADDGDDLSPHYLPEDDRIIFSSTRRPESKGIQTNEDKGSFFATDENRRNSAFSLHVREANGDIKQVSFNRSNDLDPIVLKDSGRILFSRWNHMGSRDVVSLYSMNPDGTDVQLYYGAHSHRTGQDPNSDVHFSKPQEMPDGRIIAILRPFVTNFGGGDIIFIDGKNFADNTQPIWSQQGFISGTAQTTFKQNVINVNGLSLQGRYQAIFPMLDGSNRYLMSWSSCQILSIPTDPNSTVIPCTLASQAQLNDPNVTEVPSFGLFLVDAGNNTQVPLVKPEVDTLFSDIVMVYAAKTPPIIFDQVAGVSPEINEGFATNGVGVLHIRSVYDFDGGFAAYGANLPVLDNDAMPITVDTPAKMANPKNTTADQRPARFIRITKSVGIPDRNVKRIDNAAYGVSTQQGMREIVGYAPIEPDGSVKIKVPANVPLTIGILDKDGRRISRRHQYWFQVKPGATLECIGCHVHDTTDQPNNKPHGRPDYTSTFNQGAPTTGIGFPYSVDSLWAEIGETMAETRARQSCLPSNPTPCADMKPSTGLDYVDVWTNDVAANRSADPIISIDYTDTPLSPISLASPTFAATACSNAGYDASIVSFTYCRIVINYQQHIQPIWEATANRPAAAACTSCHTAANLVNAGQLELTSGPSDLEPDHLTSYQELLSNDNAQDAAGNDIMITRNIIIDGQTVDLVAPFGVPDTETVPDPALERSPTMSTSGARNSVFMELMTGLDLNNDSNQPTDTQNHNLMLTQSELKLISEWLDIGAQYFNNPLDNDVPTN